MPTQPPYGSWRSPISAEMIAGRTLGLSYPYFDGEFIYWLESRPMEQGRSVIVRRNPDGNIQDVTPSGFNVRTLVHEYGGGSYVATHGMVFFSHYSDQQLYRQDQYGTSVPRVLTSEPDLRYADACYDQQRTRLICVCEQHTEGQEARNFIGAIAIDGGKVQELAGGRDFVACPRLSPDGSQLAWMAWDHPTMPWDAAELWLASVHPDGTLNDPRKIAGGMGDSVCQPEWSPDGMLHFVAERSGWWNLYCWRDEAAEALCPMEAEFGAPHWVFGVSCYGFTQDGQIISAYCVDGVWKLGRLPASGGAIQPIDQPYTSVGLVQVQGQQVLYAGGAASLPAAIVRLDLQSGQHELLRKNTDLELDQRYFSTPEVIQFPTEGGRTAYGFFYAPHNPDYSAPAGEKPPLVVKSHGGPTSATSAALKLGIQYYTSRGIAVLDVNYGGSTGYGREYRERLDGQWGIVDVDDCGNGARFLAEQGRVDGKRMAITGGSAGGYTTLCALTFRDVFQAGASHFGVADPEMLAQDTHKFESRYLDRLIGPYPERRDLYHERSPIKHVSGLECPVIFFQGLEDKVVPPNQAEVMVDSLRKKGIPVAYLPFEGEQHGFRRSENIIRALEAELTFFGRVFGFTPADPIPEIEIENM